MLSLFQKEDVINRVVALSLTQIAPGKNQPRTSFPPEEIAGLARSIRENGLLQPVTVRKNGERYELIAGERRVRACLMLGWDSIPAIIEEKSDEDSAVLSLIENLQRSDLNWFEEALAISRLIAELGFSQQQAAKKLSMAQSTLANKLRLLRFDRSLLERMLTGGLTERHARCLLKLEEGARPKAVEYIIENNLNVSQSEEYIDRLLSAKDRPKGKRIIVLKDLRLFFNSIDKAVDIVKQAGIDVEKKRVEDDEFITYTVRIPKTAAQVSKRHTA